MSSRKTLSVSRTRAAVALGVVVVATAGIGTAQAANTTTHALTSVSKAYLQAGVTTPGVLLKGKGFTNSTAATMVCNVGGTAVAATRTDATTTTLTVTLPACAAGDKPAITVTTGLKVSTQLVNKINVIAQPVVTAVAPATGSWTGGAAATVTVGTALPATATVQVVFGEFTTTKVVAARVNRTDLTAINFKLPAGVPGDTPGVRVRVHGVESAAVPSLFTYVSTVKATPAFWVAGAPAPLVRVDGKGFDDVVANVTVSFCGVAGTISTAVGKTLKDTSVYVTPPTAAAAGKASGGACDITVAVSGGATSAISSGSTFTYAAY